MPNTDNARALLGGELFQDPGTLTQEEGIDTPLGR
jgi:hypothetical protein